MSVEALVISAEVIKAEIKRRIHKTSVAVSVVDERVGGDFGPIEEVEAFFDRQIETLKNISEDIEKAKEKHLDSNQGKVLFFLTGSISRLEFIRGSSDIDLLGYLPEEKLNLRVSEPSIIEKIEDELIELEEQRGTDNPDISISGVPQSDAGGAPTTRSFLKRNKTVKLNRAPKRFYTRAELMGSIGQATEAPWAGFERASLIFESAQLSGSADAGNKLCEEIDTDIYKISSDIISAKFPLTAFCLAQFIGRSGLLAKVAKIRNNVDNVQLTSNESAKTVLSRVWNTNINLMCLHAVYWKHLLEDQPMNGEQIRADLRQPPIIKALSILPGYLNFYMSQPRRIEKKITDMHSSETANTLNRALEMVSGRINPETCSGVPLWYRFLQIMRICTELREANDPITLKQIQRINDWNHELEVLTQACGNITHHLALNTDSRDGMSILHSLLSDYLHGVRQP